jgi:DeoR family transcriptional regulator, aga operon transcriptional repressor
VLRAQRQARIIQQLQENGFVEISQLSARFGADRSTIRRDLQELALRGLVQRTRGGALDGPASGHADIPYEVKRIEHTPEKQAIGSHAASLVRDSEAILLDSGSTTFQVALALRRRHDISVVTNDLNIAMCLAESPGIQLIVTGGILLESVYALVGSRTVEELLRLHVDRTFLGADAIHHEAGITNVTFVEVEVKRAMIAAAREVVVVADSSKFEHRALAQVCGLEEIDLVLTDGGLDPEIRRLYGDRLACVALDTPAHAVAQPPDPAIWSRRPRARKLPVAASD